MLYHVFHYFYCPRIFHCMYISFVFIMHYGVFSTFWLGTLMDEFLCAYMFLLGTYLHRNGIAWSCNSLCQSLMNFQMILHCGCTILHAHKSVMFYSLYSSSFYSLSFWLSHVSGYICAVVFICDFEEEIVFVAFLFTREEIFPYFWFAKNLLLYYEWLIVHQVPLFNHWDD